MLPSLQRILQSITTGLAGWFSAGATRDLDARAFRIFHAIMTESCEQCLAPLTVCRRSHWMADRNTI